MCRAQTLDGLTDDFSSLETLSLNNVGLTTLKGFPNLANLKKVNNRRKRIHFIIIIHSLFGLDRVK